MSHIVLLTIILKNCFPMRFRATYSRRTQVSLVLVDSIIILLSMLLAGFSTFENGLIVRNTKMIILLKYYGSIH